MKKMSENWRDIKDYEGLYQVSDQGRVRSLGNGKTHKTSRILKPTTAGSSRKYLRVTLYKNGVSRSYSVYRLEWEAFNGPIPEGMQINHKDENPFNCNLDNLMVCTQKENNTWGTRLDRVSDTLGKWVIQLSKDNEILHFYPSASKAGKATNINRSDISSCCRGAIKTAGGFVWKYAE